jgi:hypothetical protein
LENYSPFSSIIATTFFPVSVVPHECVISEDGLGIALSDRMALWLQSGVGVLVGGGGGSGRNSVTDKKQNMGWRQFPRKIIHDDQISLAM